MSQLLKSVNKKPGSQRGTVEDQALARGSASGWDRVCPEEAVRSSSGWHKQVPDESCQHSSTGGAQSGVGSVWEGASEFPQLHRALRGVKDTSSSLSSSLPHVSSEMPSVGQASSVFYIRSLMQEAAWHRGLGSDPAFPLGGTRPWASPLTSLDSGF